MSHKKFYSIEDGVLNANIDRKLFRKQGIYAGDLQKILRVLLKMNSPLESLVTGKNGNNVGFEYHYQPLFKYNSGPSHQ